MQTIQEYLQEAVNPEVKQIAKDVKKWFAKKGFKGSIKTVASVRPFIQFWPKPPYVDGETVMLVQNKSGNHNGNLVNDRMIWLSPAEWKKTVID
jgi:hypothetical protein